MLKGLRDIHKQEIIGMLESIKRQAGPLIHLLGSANHRDRARTYLHGTL